MTESEALHAATQAVLAKLKADDEALSALNQRDAAYRELFQDHGWSQTRIEREMRKALLEAGLTEEQTKGIGISHDTVKSVVGRRRAQG